jgi:hypothetical protein
MSQLQDILNYIKTHEPTGATTIVKALRIKKLVVSFRQLEIDGVIEWSEFVKGETYEHGWKLREWL